MECQPRSGESKFHPNLNLELIQVPERKQIFHPTWRQVYQTTELGLGCSGMK